MHFSNLSESISSKLQRPRNRMTFLSRFRTNWIRKLCFIKKENSFDYDISCHKETDGRIRLAADQNNEKEWDVCRIVLASIYFIFKNWLKFNFYPSILCYNTLTYLPWHSVSFFLGKC